MRILLLLRGSPGCGKTTWIEQHGLSQYALSADNIRLMCAGPTMMPDGKMAINPNNDNAVWATLFKLLEIRMQNGEFTVIDATNSKTSEMNRYKELCAAYKYRMYCVDFTSLPIECHHVSPDETIILRFNMMEHDVDTVRRTHNMVKEEFPNNTVITIPQNLSFEYLTRANLAELKAQIEAIMEGVSF